MAGKDYSRRGGKKPDVIITDLAMPRLDGSEMIKEIRNEPEIAETPILVFTAHGSVSPEKFHAAGADRAFYKPFDFDDLVDVVKEMLVH
jgi:CheY-like chemotaxis protein